MIRETFEYARRARWIFSVGAMAAVFAVGAARGQESAVSDLELRAGERGIILTIIGSGPIAVGGSPEELEKATARYAEIRVKVSGARSALGAVKSFVPPEVLPVKELSLKESGDGVELGLKMRTATDGPVQIKSGGNHVRILLTKAPQPDVVWSAVKGLVSGAPTAGAARPDVTIPSEAERSLNDIRIVERDNTAALYFDLSASPVAAVTKSGDSLKITFANTALTPKLSAQPYSITGSAYPNVRISKGKGADGRNTVTAVVRLKHKDAAPVTAADGDSYVVRVTGVAANQVFLWSAHTGVQSSQQFAEIKPEPVDMKKMEARAARDTQPFADGQMFTVKESPQTQRKQAPAADAPAPAAAPSRSAQPQIAARPETPETVFHDGESAAASSLVRYKIYGRDPFVPLVRDGDAETELPRVEDLRLVGVLEDARERIALLEDFKNGNRAYALRVNDPVEYGKVLRVHRNKVVFLIRDFDVSRSYTLSISREAESGSARIR